MSIQDLLIYRCCCFKRRKFKHSNLSLLLFLISIILTGGINILNGNGNAFSSAAVTNDQRPAKIKTHLCGQVPLFDNQQAKELNSSRRSYDVNASIGQKSRELSKNYQKYLNLNQNQRHHHDASGKSDIQKPRISSGFRAKPGQFPSFVALRIFAEKMVNTCSGVLIDERLVLTAGHCIARKKSTDLASSKESLKVIAALSPLHPKEWESNDVDFYPSDKQCVSPLYERNPMPIWDFAIVRLNDPVEYSDLVQPACLINKPFDFTTEAYAIGIGLMSNQNGTNVYAKQLQVLPVKQVACREDNRHETRICFKASRAEYPGDTCKGDSGGPIIAHINSQASVVGLTSFGDPECWPGKAGLSTNADVYNARSHILDLAQQCADND